MEQLKKDVDQARKHIEDLPNGGHEENEGLKSRVTRFLKEEVTPVLQMDGGNIQLLHIHNGVARIRIQGGCDGCPSSIMAIIMGLEQELRRKIPEIE